MKTLGYYNGQYDELDRMSVPEPMYPVIHGDAHTIQLIVLPIVISQSLHNFSSFFA